jgi:hypothetical protein
MSKIADLFEHNLIQNFNQLFTEADAIESLLHKNIQQSSAENVNTIITQFFNLPEATETALALDLQHDEIQTLKQTTSMNDENLSSIAKIVAFLLAQETNAFEQVEVFESLQDYPM